MTIAALGVWGVTVNGPLLRRVIGGTGATLLGPIVWDLFVAARARAFLPTAARLALRLAVFAYAAAVMSVRGERGFTVAFFGG